MHDMQGRRGRTASSNNRRLAHLCSATTATTGHASAMPTAAAAARRTLTVVAFGDSITQATSGGLPPDQGWPSLLRCRLDHLLPEQLEIVVINSGVGGETSREGLRRIEHDVLVHKPDFVVWEFGNDVTLDAARHVPLPEYRKNFKAIAARVTECGGSPIPMTFTTVIDHWAPRSTRALQGEQAQERYREVARDFAREEGLPLVDLAVALRRAIAEASGGGGGGGELDDVAASEYFLPDGVHLTAGGNVCVAEAIACTLVSEIQGWLRL